MSVPPRGLQTFPRSSLPVSHCHKRVKRLPWTGTGRAEEGRVEERVEGREAVTGGRKGARPDGLFCLGLPSGLLRRDGMANSMGIVTRTLAGRRPGCPLWSGIEETLPERPRVRPGRQPPHFPGLPAGTLTLQLRPAPRLAGRSTPQRGLSRRGALSQALWWLGGLLTQFPPGRHKGNCFRLSAKRTPWPIICFGRGRETGRDACVSGAVL